MAELSTIARPYAEALFAAARAAGTQDAWLAAADELGALVRHPQVAEVVADPKLGQPQVIDLLAGMLKSTLPQNAATSCRRWWRTTAWPRCRRSPASSVC